MHRSFFTTLAAVCMLFAICAAVLRAHPGSGIAVDSKGLVFFTDTGRGVWRIDLDGTLTYVPAQLFHWMALDEAGSFATAPKDFGEHFERVTPEGSKPTLLLCSHFPLTVHTDGNLYYADTRKSHKQIVRRTPDGKESVLASGETFESIAGIASGPDGSIYITDAGRANTNAIRKITMDGKVATVAADFVPPESADPPPPETRLAYCRGLAVDASGTVYVAATGSRRVVKISPDGKATVILRAMKPWSPTGVALFRGEVYVLEWRDAPAAEVETRKSWIPRVRKIGADGAVTTLATVSREAAK